MQEGVEKKKLSRDLTKDQSYMAERQPFELRKCVVTRDKEQKSWSEKEVVNKQSGSIGIRDILVKGMVLQPDRTG